MPRCAPSDASEKAFAKITINSNRGWLYEPSPVGFRSFHFASLSRMLERGDECSCHLFPRGADIKIRQFKNQPLEKYCELCTEWTVLVSSLDANHISCDLLNPSWLRNPFPKTENLKHKWKATSSRLTQSFGSRLGSSPCHILWQCVPEGNFFQYCWKL